MKLIAGPQTFNLVLIPSISLSGLGHVKRLCLFAFGNTVDCPIFNGKTGLLAEI